MFVQTSDRHCASAEAAAGGGLLPLGVASAIRRRARLRYTAVVASGPSPMPSPTTALHQFQPFAEPRGSNLQPILQSRRQTVASVVSGRSVQVLIGE